MTNKITTVEEFCTEINVPVFIIKYYCRTFNIDLFNADYLVDRKTPWLSPSDKVTPKFIEDFSEIKYQLLEYEHDFESVRSVHFIANKINVDVHSVLKYLNKKRAYISGHKLSVGEDFASTTNLKKISSYQILNGIQLESRLNLINKNLNN